MKSRLSLSIFGLLFSMITVAQNSYEPRQLQGAFKGYLPLLPSGAYSNKEHRAIIEVYKEHYNLRIFEYTINDNYKVFNDYHFAEGDVVLSGDTIKLKGATEFLDFYDDDPSENDLKLVRNGYGVEAVFGRHKNTLKKRTGYYWFRKHRLRKKHHKSSGRAAW